MKYYKILFTLLILQSCNTATLSDIEANTISNLQVEIVIEDGFKEKSLHKINAHLSNGEKRIDNENIKILLNGKPLELFVRTGNYYDKHPVYTTDDLVRSESYYFEIILPDSSKYPLAFIKPSKRNDSTKFYIPKKNSRNNDFVLEWKNNNRSTSMEIWKLVHQKHKPNMHSGGRYAETTIKHIINSENGNYKVPKLFYKDSLTIADYLKIRLSSLERGLINPELKTNSEILYTSTLEKTVELED